MKKKSVLIEFSEKVCYYDNNTPLYVSSCGRYHLTRHRHGACNEKGKCEKDQWSVYYRRGPKGSDWNVIQTRIATKQEAIEVARMYDRHMSIRLQLEAEEAKAKR